MFYSVEYEREKKKQQNENNLFHLFYKNKFEKSGSMISYLVILRDFLGVPCCLPKKEVHIVQFTYNNIKRTIYEVWYYYFKWNVCDK